MTFYDDSPVPNAEIEAGADALPPCLRGRERVLWESPKNQQSVRETGLGANWLYQAQVALEAALKVRGKPVADAPEGLQ